MRFVIALLGAALVLTLALLARSAFAREQPALDERAFAQAALERLQRRVPESRFVLREREGHPSIDMSWPDGNSGTWFLANAYRQCNGDAAQLDAIVEHQLQTWAEARAAMSSTAPARSAAAARVLPEIKTRDWLEHTIAQLNSAGAAGQADDSVPLHRDLAGDLVLVFVEDDAKSMRYIGRGMLESLQLRNTEALEARALANLAARLGELKVNGKDGRYRLELDDFHEASLLLLAPRWRERVAIDGEPVIAVAARNTLLVCGSRDRGSIETLRRFAADISRQAAYGLSAKLYTWRDGRLVVYAP